MVWPRCHMDATNGVGANVGMSRRVPRDGIHRVSKRAQAVQSVFQHRAKGFHTGNVLISKRFFS